MPFQKTNLNFKELHLLSLLVSDYLSGNEKVRPFYNVFPDESGFRSLIENRKNYPVDRKVLTEVLTDQNRHSHEEVKKNISLLENEKTFTITTGHQLNLFTGPLYFIYKVLTVIKLSAWLNQKFPENKFIPVYWMASEDHDIAEISHTYISGKKIEWHPDSYRDAAGRLKCNGIESVIGELKSLIGENPLLKIISDAYQESRTLSEATGILVNALFGKYGLVTIDPDNAKLKEQFIPKMKEELLHQVSFEKTSETIASLEKMHYNIQVSPREINLFYLTENSRERIVKNENGWKVLNSDKVWSETEIIAELQKNPEQFSPNVVLRPLYQETILPNLAYVGGPSEIAYWLEYKSMFDHFKSHFPALVLRNCAMIVDGTSGNKMVKLKISEVDLFKSVDELSRQFVKSDSDAFSMSEEVDLVNKAFDSIYRKAQHIDPTMSQSVAGEKQKQQNALKSLEERIIRAEKKKHENSIQQIQKLKEKFFPEGTLQERHENFIPFWLEHGESFFDDLLESFEPVSSHFHFLLGKGTTGK